MVILRKFQMLILCHLCQPYPMILKSESYVNSSSATGEAPTHIQPTIMRSASSSSCWKLQCLYIPKTWPSLCTFAKSCKQGEKQASGSPEIQTLKRLLLLLTETEQRNLLVDISVFSESPGIWAGDIAQSV